MDYKSRVKKIAAECFEVETDQITDDLVIGEIETWDSVGNLAFISRLEEELEIDFPIEDLYELNNIKAIVEEINKLKNE